MKFLIYFDQFGNKFILLFLLLINLSSNLIFGQSIEFSNLVGNRQLNVNEKFGMQTNHTFVENGFTYIVGTGYNIYFPITNDYRTFSPSANITNSSNGVTYDQMFVVKLKLNGEIDYFTAFNESYVTKLIVKNGEVYVGGYANPSYFPNSSITLNSDREDCFVTKLNSDGTLAYSHVFGDQNSYDIVNDFIVDGNEVYMTGYIDGYNDNDPSSFIAKVNSSNNLEYYNKFGGTLYDEGIKILNNGNHVFVAGYTNSSDYFDNNTTNSSFITDFEQDIFIQKIDKSNGLFLVNNMFGSPSPDYMSNFFIENGEPIVAGYISSDLSSSSNGKIFVTKLTNNCQINYNQTKEKDLDIYSYAAIIDNNKIYHSGVTGVFNSELFVSKFDLTNSMNDYIIKIEADNYDDLNQSMQIFNDSIFLSGITNSSNFPTTDNTQVNSSWYDNFLMILDAQNGNISYSTIFGGLEYDWVEKMKVDDCRIHLIGVSRNTDFFNFNSLNSKNLVYYLFNHRAKYLAKKEFESKTNEYPLDLFIENNDVYFTGLKLDANSYGDNYDYQGNTNYPITDPNFNTNYYQAQFTIATKLNLNPTFNIGSDILSNSNQTICQNGFAQEIVGIKISSSNFPTVYYDGYPYPQEEFVASYQWLVSQDNGQTWQNIPGATQKNYTPPVLVGTSWYKRQTFNKLSCPILLLSTSDLAVVTVGNTSAPIVNAGGNYHTCFGAGGVQINATVTGGTGNYIYEWDYGLSAVEDPYANPQSTTIYTLKVTDEVGCSQIDQATVNVYQASAGPDVSICGGMATNLVATPIQGVAGVVYSWSPTNNLNNPNNIQPTVSNLLTDVDYTLTIEIPTPFGSNQTCALTDQVHVFVVEAPTNTNFAGEDKTVCYGENVSLGSSPEDGFEYTWTPGIYLNTNNGSEVIYNSGTLDFPPNSDPATYTVNAKKNGCSFIQSAVVNIIRADAGLDGCGPRIIGGNTDVTTLNETFTWKIISGDGYFIDYPNNNEVTLNSPQISVSASQAETIYQLTTSLNGVSCTDLVSVPNCQCRVNIEIENEFGCPNANLGDLILKASAQGLGTDIGFHWSPQIGLESLSPGLNAYDQASVKVIGLDYVVYTVTAYNLLDNTIICEETIEVNKPTMILPIFDAKDYTICPGLNKSLGETSIAGYSYFWSPTTGNLSDPYSSNPTVSPIISTNYTVLVTDNVTGCYITDISHIIVKEIDINAGIDRTVCNNSQVILGTSEIENYIYSWSPSDAPWINGTNENSANPEVLVSIDMEFTLTILDQSTGCSLTDQVILNLNNNPTIPDISDITICNGEAVSIINEEIPGVIYSWSPSTGLDCPTCSSPIASPSSTITYTLTATFPGECVPVSKNVTVFVNQPIEFTLADVYYCPYGSPYVIGDDAPLNNLYTYKWFTTGNIDLYLDNKYSRNPSVNYFPYFEKEYTLTITDNNGCSSSATMKTIPSLVAPNPGSSQTVCIGETTTLGSDLNPTGTNYIYNWYPQEYFINPNSPTPTFIANEMPFQNPLYIYVELTDNNINCTTYSDLWITLKDVNILPIQSAFICNGNSIQLGYPLNELNNEIGTEYYWSTNNNTLTSLSNSNFPLTEATPQTTTTYTLTAVSPDQCVASVSTTVGVSEFSAPTIILEDVEKCFSENQFQTQPSVTPSGQNYSYLWSSSQTLFEIDPYVSSSYILNPVIYFSNIGEFHYYFTVTNNDDGCQAQEDFSLTIVQCPPPCVLSIESPSFFCSENSISVFASASPTGGTFLWNTGQYGQVLNINNPENVDQTYAVTYTISDNCVLNSSVTIPFNNNCCSPPTIDCSDNLTITSNYDNCDELVSQSTLLPPTILDISSYCPIFSISNNAPLTFTPGLNVVEWTVINVEGDISTCTQNVILTVPQTNTGGN